MLDVGFARVELFNLGMIEVETGDALANVGKPESKRKTHVSAADNSDFDALLRKKLWVSLHAFLPGF